jgi:hypothetical protein
MRISFLGVGFVRFWLKGKGSMNYDPCAQPTLRTSFVDLSHAYRWQALCMNMSQLFLWAGLLIGVLALVVWSSLKAL